MRRLLLCVLLAGCGGKDSPGDLVTAWSVTHYDYAIDFTTRAATATLTIDATGAGHCFAIPFAPEAVGEVTIDGARARTSLDAGVLTACGRAVDAEAITFVAELVVPEDTLFASDVGFSTFADAEGNDQTYLLSWVNECDRHGPCDSTPGIFASYRFVIDHDPAQQVLCPGTITTPQAGRTVCDVTTPGPTYSTFGAIAGDWDATPLGTWGGVNATLYDTPSTGIAAALQTSSLQGFFEWMETTFGEYPYGSELRLITANSYWSGFEHPGNIVLNDGLASAQSRYADPLTHVAIHEIAHMWAGDETTLASTYDFAWKEAMAEYLSWVYEDERLGPAIADETPDAWKYFASGADYFPVPEESPELFSFYGDVYGPGPMILFRQIEQKFGRPAVIAALQAVLGDERALSVADVRDALEVSTGASLDTYFDAWVYGSGAPSFPEATISWSQPAADATVTATITTADGTPRPCIFAVQLTGTSGNAVDVVFDTWNAVTPQTVTPGFTVTGATLDPYDQCLIYPPTAIRGMRTNPWVARD